MNPFYAVVISIIGSICCFLILYSVFGFCAGFELLIIRRINNERKAYKIES